MQDDIDDTDTPGWDAINAALATLYAGQTPQHFGTALPYTLGGQDPLDGISVYWADAPQPHWHYVTYGFSELYAKESSDAQVSGYGFELTFRLAASAGERAGSTPPVWPMNLLQNLARYVFGSGNVFEDGHHLNANGPIALETDTRLCHLAFVADPQLPPRDTGNGHLQFLQLVGLTDEEMEAIRRWSTRGVLQVLQPAMPLWISDLHRGNLLDDPVLAAQVQEGSQREGSTTGMLFVETLRWRQQDGVTTLVLGAGQVHSVAELLGLRLRHGKPLELVSGERQWTFAPGGAEAATAIDDDSVYWVLDEAGLQAAAALAAQRGVYPLDAALQIEVVPTQLRDGKGNVIREIG
ncbi:suppressor of fused domain protein [Stenotrophomonas sp. S48]|uniref:suppressor of fused domain protein n=1 Tax=unclassified Stenotrophomonas TaxID=196198 RepID=UPI001901498B|nr:MULTISPECIES: suppressor of fused domain protein [unclassified Stenotrophomonas]MBK0028361.1 suppressor of fused domain protein [Stenotrophomonas sp. S48]MBK0050199.1 suppressor of fused domain protein [Stenotrophomonas sp. S49]